MSHLKLVKLMSRYLAPLGVFLTIFSTSQDIQAQEQKQSLSQNQSGIALNKEPDTNDPKTLEAYFLKQIEEAIRAGDLNKREAVLRRWLERSPGSRPARDTLGFFLVRYSKDPSEGISLLESALDQAKSEKRYFPFTTTAAKLIEFFASIGEFEPADKLISSTRDVISKFSTISDQGELPYRKVYSEARFNGALANYFYYRGNVKEGIDASKKSISGFSRLDKFVQPKDPRAQSHANLNHFRGLVRLASFHRLAGNYYSAEQALRDAFEVATKVEQKGDVTLGVEIATLRFEQGLFKDSELSSRKILETWKDNNLDEVSAQVLNVHTVLNRALAAQEKWGQLLEQFKFLDHLASSNSHLKGLSYQPDIRWLGHYFSGDVERAEQITEDLYAASTKIYETGHPTISLHRGFYAVALSKSKDPVKIAKAKVLFEKSIFQLSEGRSPGVKSPNDFERSMLNLIFHSYAKLLLSGTSSSDRDVDLAFSTLALESGSSVQTAIQDAAVRTGLNDPELSELVRLDQDNSIELEALYRILADQGQDGAHQVTVMSKIRSRIKEINQSKEELKKRIEEKRPDFATLTTPRPISASDVRAALGPSEVLLSIHSIEDRFISFSIDRNSIRYSVSDMTPEHAGALVARLRKTLDVADRGSRAPSFDFSSGLVLYEAFIKPHEEIFKGKRSLIISTSSTLSQIPFSVLPTTNWTGKNYVDAPWLAKEIAISYAVSPSAWLATKRLAATRAEALPLLAWGDPSYKPRIDAGRDDNVPALSKATRSANIERASPLRDLVNPIVDSVIYENLPPLPETRDEVVALAKALGANDATDLILGQKATRKSVLDASQAGDLANRSVVVFATHGLIAGDLPNLSQPALAMASTSAPDESPLLTLDDVLSLKLNADWVVLSACNTAAADGRAGEALSGLARGFFYAGSRSLLVTHWSVESRSATLLTTETFKAYQADQKLTRAEALNRAVLSVMKMPEYRHPAFWAPYVLVGEGGR